MPTWSLTPPECLRSGARVRRGWPARQRPGWPDRRRRHRPAIRSAVRRQQGRSSGGAKRGARSQHVRAQFIEADNVQCKFLEPFQQPIELRLIAYRSYYARPAVARLDEQFIEEPGQQMLAFTPKDDSVPAGGADGCGHVRAFLRLRELASGVTPLLPQMGDVTPLYARPG